MCQWMQAHDALLEFSSSKPQDHYSTEVPEGSGNPNPTASTSNPPADQIETLIVETPIPTVNESNGMAADISNIETAITASPTPRLRIHKDHPKSQIIGLMDTPIQTRNKSKEVEEQKPKKISDALQDPSWVEAMQEELLQFKIQNVWTLVDCPKGVRPIGTKWVLKIKKDERGIVIRNKARLVAQEHTQEEGIDYDEVFSPVARIGILEDKDRGRAEPAQEDAPIIGRSMDIGEVVRVERSTELGSNDTEEMRLSEQLTRDSEIARLYAEEELKMMIEEKIELINELVKYQDHQAKILKYQAQQKKPLSKKEQREFYMSVLKSHVGWKTKHFRGMTLEEIEEKFIPV
nr:putative ribonuclease H-like domain-containing protein [Tanacetum cinerariifolium]